MTVNKSFVRLFSCERLKVEFYLYHAGYDLSKRWCVYYNLDGSNLKATRIRKEAGINFVNNKRLRKQAAHKLARSIQSILLAGGKIGQNHSLIYKAIAAEFKSRRNVVRSSTYQTYFSKLNRFDQYLIDKKMRDCTPAKFSKRNALAFLKFLLNDGLSATTHNQYITLLRGGFDKLYLKGKNPFEGIKSIHAVPVPARYFGDKQIKQIKDHLKKKDPVLWMFVQMIYYCYLRPSRELRLLKVGNINLVNRSIYVEPDKSKNRKGQFVKIPDPLYNQLIEMKIQHMEPEKYLFGLDKFSASEPVGKNYFKNHHRAALEDIGISTDEYKLYSWKHTGVVKAAQASVPIIQIQLQLRHSSLNTTYQYLRQLGINDMDKLAKIFPEI